MARRIRASRLSRNSERQTRKQLIIFGLGIVAVIFILFQFGGFLLNVFGNIIFGIKGEEDQSFVSNSIEEVLAAPNLLDLPNATPSARINISGTTNYSEGRISLYINGTEVDTNPVDDDGEFIFRNIGLELGKNRIKAHYYIDDRKSDFSKEFVLIRSTEKPLLEIDYPADNSTFTKADKKISILGKTDANNSVRVNGFRAVVDADGGFSYLLELNDGDNKISIETTNEAGLSTLDELTVVYRSE